jgi:hypothetical protein
MYPFLPPLPTLIPPTRPPPGGLWQTELGWNGFEGLLPSVYTRFFHWAVGNGSALSPAAGRDAYRLMWYAWWQPSDNRTLVNSAPGATAFGASASNVPTFHGRQLAHLATLFGANGTAAVEVFDGNFSTQPALPADTLGDGDPGAVGFRVQDASHDRAVVVLYLAANASGRLIVSSHTLTPSALQGAQVTGGSLRMDGLLLSVYSREHTSRSRNVPFRPSDRYLRRRATVYSGRQRCCLCHGSGPGPFTQRRRSPHRVRELAAERCSPRP